MARKYLNAAMDRGNRMEPVLRANYALKKGVDPVTVGFIKKAPDRKRRQVRRLQPDSLVSI